MADPLELRITHYPAPVLRKRSEEVEAFDEGLAELVAGMFERMRESQGVGLAAPQVGIGRRVLVWNATGKPEDDKVLVNPEIVERSGPETTYEEGCLSFPGIYAEVRRPDRCKVRSVDLQGNAVEQEFEGFESRVVQHEFDHLEGVLLVDRMSPADKLRNKAALQDLVDHYKARQVQAAPGGR